MNDRPIDDWIKLTKILVAENNRQEVKRAVDEISDLVTHRSEANEVVKEPETHFSADRTKIRNEVKEMLWDG